MIETPLCMNTFTSGERMFLGGVSEEFWRYGQSLNADLEPGGEEEANDRLPIPDLARFDHTECGR